MDRKKLLKRAIYLIFFIFIVNFLANKFYWYSSIWYFDMIMHFLGGFWLGLVCFYLFSLKIFSQEFFHAAFKVSVFVLFIGLGWEIFELVFNNIVAQNPFNYLDASSDIFFDLSGGLCAILYIWKKQLK